MRNEIISSQILKNSIVEIPNSSKLNYGTQNNIAITVYSFNGNIKFYGSLDKENWFQLKQNNKNIEYLGFENNIESKTIFFLINTNTPWFKIEVQFRDGPVIASEQRVQGKIDNIHINRA